MEEIRDNLVLALIQTMEWSRKTISGLYKEAGYVYGDSPSGELRWVNESAERATVRAIQWGEKTRKGA